MIHMHNLYRVISTILLANFIYILVVYDMQLPYIQYCTLITFTHLGYKEGDDDDEKNIIVLL